MREDVFPELGISQSEFADKLGVSRRTVNEVLTEKRPVSPIWHGIDVTLSQARETLIAAQSARLTFAAAARRKYDALSREFRNLKHSREWLSSLERVFGDMDVNDVALRLHGVIQHFATLADRQE